MRKKKQFTNQMKQTFTTRNNVQQSKIENNLTIIKKSEFQESKQSPSKINDKLDIFKKEHSPDSKVLLE